MSFNYSFLLFSYIENQRNTLLDQRRAVAWKASFTQFFLLFHAQNLLELLTFCSSLPLDFNASKLMCNMLAEKWLLQDRMTLHFGQLKRKAADTLIAELQWTFLWFFESLRGIETKLKQWYQATSFGCRQQVEIKAKPLNFSQSIRKKCDFSSSGTGNNFHLCSSHCSSNL